MLRLYLIIVIYILASEGNNLKAQEDTELYVVSNKYKFGINISILRSGNTRWYISPNFQYSNKKHTFFAGPKLQIEESCDCFLVCPSIERYVDEFTNKLGFFLGYQFYPNGMSRKFNFHFDIVAHHSFSKFGVWTGYEWYYLGYVNTINWLLGYGFKWRIWDNFYFNQSVGFGYYHDFEIWASKKSMLLI